MQCEKDHYRVLGMKINIQLKLTNCLEKGKMNCKKTAEKKTTENSTNLHHETIIGTGITCEKISCYIRNSACIV